MGSLETYLKSINSKNPEKLLVDQGTGSTLNTKPSIEFDENNLIVIKREKGSTYSNTAELAVISGNLNSVYPGSIIHADSKLVDGMPNIVTGLGLKRKPIAISLDIFGNTQEPIIVDEPNQSNVMRAIYKMVENWCHSHHSAAAQMTYKTISVYDEKQLNVEFGAKGAGNKFNIDFKAITTGKKKEMLVFFNQIYYSARVEPQTASYLYEDNVDSEALKNNGVNENNPLAALVASVDYGRQIVVKLSTSNTSEEVELAWKGSVNSNGFSNKDEYKHIMDKTSFSVFVLGGTTKAAGELIQSQNNLAEINKIIASDMNFTSESAAYPLSYTTYFIDDGSKALVSRSTDYIKTTMTKREPIRVITDTANAYITKHQKFWARPVTGIEDNGTFKLGDWECLKSGGNGNMEFLVDGKYVEFGFEFDITGGTDWPYSDVFWKVSNGVAKKIFFNMGGACRTAKIDIEVNGKNVFHDGNCDKHRRKF